MGLVHAGITCPGAKVGGKMFWSSQATVWEKVLVCLPRDGNGTERREAIWLMEWDGSPRFLGGTG